MSQETTPDPRITDPLASEESLAAFVAAFEGHTLPKEAFTHAAHVTVAACYLHGANSDVVLPRIRQAIRSFNESVGGANTKTAGYHETLTVFWLRVVERKLNEVRPASRLEAARQAVAAYGDRRELHAEYYSGDVVKDTNARREWREPDLKAIG
jgi:hypothetical protein